MPPSGAGHWRAELELWFEARADETFVARRRHLGPLTVQRPFHPEADGTAHVYVLHPPGGVVGGDSLDVACHVGAGARALLTAPGATKFYRSAGAQGTQRITIDVGPGAVCEHLPQETIVYDGAIASIDTRVSLASDAIYVGWDLISLGRPAAGETFANGSMSHRVQVSRAGRPIWYERTALTGGSDLSGAAYAFAGRPVFGVMIYAGPTVEDAVEPIRTATEGLATRGAFTVTHLEDAVACRYLGASMWEGKTLFIRAWEVLREAGLGKPAVKPRVWST